ncbi:hypothetical protein [Haladaptatus sp. NG-WS-4]
METHTDWGVRWSVNTTLGVLVVGLGFVGTQLLVGDVLVSLRLLSPPAVESSGTKLPLVAGGLIVGVTLAVASRRLGGSRRWHVVVWTTLLFLNMAGVLLEGTFFAPDLAPMENLPGGMVTQLLAAAVTAGLAAWLFVPDEATGRPSLRNRAWSSWLVRLLAGALTYVVLFWVVGAANYLLVTKPYYEAQMGGITTPDANVVLVLEVVRGHLIALSVVPFVRSVRASRRERATVAGLVLFVFSGLVPLTYQLGTLPPFLLFASGYEILLQVGPTGAVVAVLLGSDEDGHESSKTVDATHG